MIETKQRELPPLIDLTVCRETYCSQKITDEILVHLWKERPDLVGKQFDLEDCRGNGHDYLDHLALIVDFLKPKLSQYMKESFELGLIDILSEMSRRLRKIKGFPDITILGKEFSIGPESKYSELPNLPIEYISKKPLTGLPQEVVDHIIQEAYARRPDLFFLSAEVLRRNGIWPWHASNPLKQLFIEVAKPQYSIYSFQASQLLS